MSEPLIVKLNARLARRFATMVEKRGASDCWLWKGGKDRNGYPIFTIRGRKVYARKVAFVLAHTKDFGEGEYVNLSDLPLLGLSCQRTECVYPGHITPGIPTLRRYENP